MQKKEGEIVGYKIKGLCFTLVGTFEGERIREGRRPIQTWEKMKRELKKRFVSENYKQESFMKFYSFKQNNLLVEDYIREFEYLMLRCEISELEEKTIARFLGGLKRELADAIRL